MKGKITNNKNGKEKIIDVRDFAGTLDEATGMRNFTIEFPSEEGIIRKISFGPTYGMV